MARTYQYKRLWPWIEENGWKRRFRRCGEADVVWYKPYKTTILVLEQWRVKQTGWRISIRQVAARGIMLEAVAHIDEARQTRLNIEFAESYLIQLWEKSNELSQAIGNADGSMPPTEG